MGGVERSGTSLLQRILCSHSRVVGGPELMFGGRIAELHRHVSWISRQGPAPYRRRLTRYLDSEEIDRQFRTFFRGFFRNLVGEHDASLLISEKTPSNIFFVRELLGLFPSSRFVHLVRDGRDVVASHRDVGLRAAERPSEHLPSGLSLRRVCSRWSRAAEVHRQLLADSELRARYLWLRYEDLVREPEEQLTQLMSFLDLELEPLPLRPEEQNPSTLVLDEVWHVEGDDRRPFGQSRIGRWRRDLDPASKLLTNLLLAHGLETYGYGAAPGALALGAPLRAAARLVERRRAETQ